MPSIDLILHIVSASKIAAMRSKKKIEKWKRTELNVYACINNVKGNHLDLSLCLKCGWGLEIVAASMIFILSRWMKTRNRLLQYYIVISQLLCIAQTPLPSFIQLDQHNFKLNCEKARTTRNVRYSFLMFSFSIPHGL